MRAAARHAPFEYDALVVGAGPAGATTALGLARRGFRVGLLDRREFPRSKPCGDCLSPEAARVLDRLGVLARVEGLAPARLDGWRIWSPDGGAFVGCFAAAAQGDPRIRTAMAVRREPLDDVLRRAAIEAGAEADAPIRVEGLILEGRAVAGVVARDADDRRLPLRARIVIGADGLRSVVARRAGATLPPGRLRKLSLTLHPRLPAGFTNGLGEMHVIAGGCIGLAPVETGEEPLHNLTLVATSTVRGRLVRRDAHGFVDSMLRAAPGLRDRLAMLLAAIARCGPTLASGPFDRPVRFVIADGLALVGDAAGYYDPFTGQGVYQALAGGERIARIAGDALIGGTGVVRKASLRPYARWLGGTRRPARAVQRAIEYVTAHPLLMNRLVPALERTPSFADALVATTGDIAPVRSLAGPPLAALGHAFVRGRTAR